MGLSVKWASCNVGATKPEEYGCYYAWGEIEKKSNYSWSTYKWYNDGKKILTKYCTVSRFGAVDNNRILDPEDDIAHVEWGGNWRLPTRDEIKKLRKKCIWQWVTVNGVNGYKVTGPNGNSIFLPAAGYREGRDLFLRGSYGGYWSSSLDSGYNCIALYFGFGGGYYDWDSNDRSFGLTVRPVCK